MNIKQVVTFFCFVFTSSTIFAQPVAVIKGPVQSSPGDLIILDASGSTADDFDWMLANSDKSYLTFENDSKLVFASGVPGSYTFVLAAASVVDVDGQQKAAVALTTHTIRIGNGPGPVDPDTPDPVEPIDPVEPDVPDPVDPVDPVTPDLDGLALASYEQVNKITSSVSERKTLASNLRTVTSKAAGLSWPVSKMLQELKSLNNDSPFSSQEVVDRWGSYLQWFGEAMKGRNDRDSAIEGLNQIAEGLEATLKSTVRSVGTFNSGDRANDSLKGMVRQIRGSLNNLKQEVGD